MLSGHEKLNKGVFAKRFKKNSVGTETTTNNRPTDSISINILQIAGSGIQLLPASLPASGYTAKPLSFDICNGQTVYNYTLYDKQENEKAVKKHFNDFEPAIREKARARIWTSAQLNCAPGRNRYTTGKLLATPIHSIYNLVFLK